MKKFLPHIIIAISIVLFVYLEILLGCPIRRITGIPCAGCGLTRASLNALCGNFKEAFYYHPLFFLPYAFGAYSFFTFRKKRSEKFMNIYKIIFGICIFAFLSLYVYRLVFNKIP